MNATNSFLSVLAVCISGNANLYGKLENSEASRAVDRCLKRIQRSVEASGGGVIRAGGGEVMAAFGVAEAVLNAAVEMQQRIADLPPVSGVKMSIRVGISCHGGSRSGQSVEDALAVEAAHLVGVAKSGQILAVGRIRKSLPASMRTLASDTGATLPNGSGRKEAIVEISGSAGNVSLKDASAGSTATSGNLHLRYGEDAVVLDEQNSVIDMGRSETCKLVIRDPRASRQHATIERRGNLVVLIDSSTNGTYVTIDGGSEQFVKHSECVLHGNGVISFAASSSAPDADCIRFEFR
ncbi:MAG: FHA domain-containing protein [Candidatus Accumulibacter sp.]|jgi:class 3 adenylate cyclase|nr:FHA domain-containing protein [Accumulibacter sp.]